MNEEITAQSRIGIILKPYAKQQAISCAPPQKNKFLTDMFLNQKTGTFTIDVTTYVNPIFLD